MLNYAESSDRNLMHFKGINGFQLKMIAIITMFIDHMAAVLISPDTDWNLYKFCRIIGRLAFPIFCFLLVEGFFHTKNIKKYILRLGIFALISELPFDLAFSDNKSEFLYHQNVFFTLFIGLGVIYLIRLIDEKYEKNLIIRCVLDFIAIAAGCMLADMLATDYNRWGILLIVVFYLFRGNKILLLLGVLLVNYTMDSLWQIYAVISVFFIWFYNGERGPQGNKYLFYIFYPAHIFLLYLISLLPVFS